VIDGPGGHDAAARPNQLLVVSLPFGPMPDAVEVVRACGRTLLTSVGLRSLGPGEQGYQSRHRGGPAERDEAYHTGTVWPWLIGPYVEAALRTGSLVAALVTDAHRLWGSCAASSGQQGRARGLQSATQRDSLPSSGVTGPGAWPLAAVTVA